jgi:hypothetical protein
MRGTSSASSLNWAGYAATGGTYHTVQASWKQPSVTCAPGESSYSSFWVGLDGYNSRTVEQIGTSADCNNGTPTYYAWYELYPKLSGQLPITIAPGQSITAKVSTTGNGVFTVSLSVNGGAPQTITGKVANASLSSAEVITEAPSSNHSPSGTLPLADFGGVSFSGATVDGSALASSNSQEITMVLPDGTVKAQPSTVSNGSFSVTWKHA